MLRSLKIPSLVYQNRVLLSENRSRGADTFLILEINFVVESLKELERTTYISSLMSLKFLQYMFNYILNILGSRKK